MEENNNEHIFCLAKFGRRDHLEALQKGTLFLNSIKNYRDDGTDYRGDSFEGAIPINPMTLTIKDENGKDIFNKIPRPTTVKETINGDDSMLMFCATAITKEIMTCMGDKTYTLSDKFKKDIRKFGDYVLVFWSCYLVDGLRKSQLTHEPKFGFESGCIGYRDLNDFSPNGSYGKAYKTTGRYTDRYFVKGLNYKSQNEWRIILDGSEVHFKLNEFGGYIIQIEEIKDAMLLEADTFLNSCSLTDEDE